MLFRSEEQMARSLLAVSVSDSPYVMHYDARELMAQGDYGRAYGMLHSILLGEESLPEPVLYFVFCDLEICCREIRDFKGAYEYSIDKMELAQKLLA